MSERMNNNYSDSHRNRTVLLVIEDDEELDRLIRSSLEQTGSTIVSVTRGSEAIDWLNANDEFAMVVECIWPDIDGKQRVTEARLRESEERFGDLFENASDLIQSVDVEGRFLSVNASWLKVLNYKEEDLVHLRLTDIVAPDEQEDYMLAVEQIRQGRECVNIETKLMTRDGKEVFVEGNIGAWMEDGKFVATRCIFRDITERKQTAQKIQEQYEDIEIHAFELEAANSELRHAQEKLLEANMSLEENVKKRTAELQAANEELEAFTYSVSHDLRGPLRHINGFSRILQQEYGDELSDESARYLDKIAESASNMGSLVDGLLNLSRVGRRDVDIKSVDINVVVNEVKTELEPETGDRDIEWKVDQLSDIECDPVLIKQVMVNLITNAIKFTRKRQRAIIEIRRLPNNNSGFIVEDNGVGFDMEYAGKLFGVFERLHRKGEFEGTGIGLATVRRIINNHGGRVWAESEVDKGSIFYVEFPSGNDEETEVS